MKHACGVCVLFLGLRVAACAKRKTGDYFSTSVASLGRIHYNIPSFIRDTVFHPEEFLWYV